MIADVDERFMALAYELASKSYAEGGCPIGGVLVGASGEVLGKGHNALVQEGNPDLSGNLLPAPKPFAFVHQRVGRRRRAHGVDAEAGRPSIDAPRFRVVEDDYAMKRARIVKLPVAHHLKSSPTVAF